jgi:hypothetical protein
MSKRSQYQEKPLSELFPELRPYRLSKRDEEAVSACSRLLIERTNAPNGGLRKLQEAQRNLDMILDEMKTVSPR